MEAGSGVSHSLRMVVIISEAPAHIVLDAPTAAAFASHFDKKIARPTDLPLGWAKGLGRWQRPMPALTEGRWVQPGCQQGAAGPHVI